MLAINIIKIYYNSESMKDIEMAEKFIQDKYEKGFDSIDIKAKETFHKVTLIKLEK